jgi:hypothetical protein
VLFERYRDEAPCGHVERRRAALDLARLRRHWCVPALRFSSGATYLDRSCQRQLSVAPNASMASPCVKPGKTFDHRSTNLDGILVFQCIH